jgi:hypothetical protein
MMRLAGLALRRRSRLNSNVRPHMTTTPRRPLDCHGVEVTVGSKVRVLSLSGDWYDRLPSDERALVESMIGDVFEVEEIDQYGQPWVCKRRPDHVAGTCQSHSVALEPHEMLSVSASNDEPSAPSQDDIDLAKAIRDFEELAAKLNGGGDGPCRA